jgi:hypothetical protein
VTNADFRMQEEIKALVKKSILEASTETLEKHIYSCEKLMKSDV